MTNYTLDAQITTLQASSVIAQLNPTYVLDALVTEMESEALTADLRTSRQVTAQLTTLQSTAVIAQLTRTYNPLNALPAVIESQSLQANLIYTPVNYHILNALPSLIESQSLTAQLDYRSSAVRLPTLGQRSAAPTDFEQKGPT